MNDEIKRFTFRIPTETFNKITEVAETNHRSVNAEIIVAIESYLDTIVSEQQSKDN